MEVTRVPLAERIGMAQEGRTAQPEYLPSLIRLAPEEDLTYQDMALMLFDLLYRDNSRGAEATQLLAVPVLAAWKQVQERRETHG